MLLAIDVGNTNIVLGVFDGERLAESWRLATLRERTADEVGILVTHLFERSRIDLAAVDGIILSSVVPPLTRTMEEMAERYFGRNAADRRSRASTPACRSCTCRRRTSAPIASSTPSRRTRRTAARTKAPGDRRGLRHRDDVRRDLGARGIHRRRDLSGHRHLGRRALPARRAAAARGRAQADVDHRPDDRHVDAVGAVLRLRVDGGRHRVAHARRARRSGDRATCIATGGMAEILSGETTAIEPSCRT